MCACVCVCVCVCVRVNIYVITYISVFLRISLENMELGAGQSRPLHFVAPGDVITPDTGFMRCGTAWFVHLAM